LPLLLRDAVLACPGGRVVRLVDPTEVLARRCVAYALGEGGARAQAVASAAGPVSVESAYG
jgi:aspartate racemase